MNTFSDPQKIIEYFPIFSGQKVADFGAGSGAYTFLLAEKVKGGTQGAVYAVEVQKNLVEQLSATAEKKGMSYVHPVWGDIESPKGSRLRDGSVNAVLVANTLFQVDHPGNVIKEARRVLGYEGVLIIIDWAESFGNIGPKQDHVISKDAAELLIAEHGFEIERSFNAGEHHYGFIARKKA